MAYGFLSINDWGDYQISDSYMNLSFKYKGTSPLLRTDIYIGGFGIGNITLPMASVTVNAPGYTPILAIKTQDPTHTAYTISMAREPGTDNYRFTIYGYASPSGNFITVDYYVFGSETATDPSNSANTYGLQLYNEVGTLTYNSNNGHLNIVNNMSLGSPSSGNSVSSTTSLTPGRTYAYICQSQWSNAVYWQYAPGLSPSWFRYSFTQEIFLNNSGTPSITLNWKASSYQTTKGAADTNVFTNLMVITIDVTGF